MQQDEWHFSHNHDASRYVGWWLSTLRTPSINQIITVADASTAAGMRSTIQNEHLPSGLDILRQEYI